MTRPDKSPQDPAFSFRTISEFMNLAERRLSSK